MSELTGVVQRWAVRIVAPSGDHAALFPTRREAARRDLASHGFDVSIGVDVLERRPNRSDAAARAAALTAAFEDPDVDVVMAAIGGWDAIDLLLHLDFDLLARTGKPLVGYSDINVLQLTGWAGHRLRSITGPMLLTQFGDARGVDSYTLASLRRALEGTTTRVVVDDPGYQLPPHQPWGGPGEGTLRDPEPGPLAATVHEGEATGPLIASNLSSLLSLAGTSAWPDLSGAVLLLEAAEVQQLHDVRAALVRLRLMGCFEGLGALGFGRFTDASSVTTEELTAAIQEVVPRSLPTVIQLPFGHVDPIASLELGQPARLTAGSSAVLEVGPSLSHL